MMKRILICCGLLLVLSCTHTEAPIVNGIQPGHHSFVPAKIAVLDCQMWPNGGRYEGLPLSTINNNILDQLCGKFNKFVLDGFSGQPFMRGLAPKAVEQLLVKAKKKALLSKVDAMWVHRAEDCANCTEPAEFYVKSIAGRNEWRTWLYEIGSAASNSDAVLMPMVTYAIELVQNDRGVREFVRRVGITMLLVDTYSGQLLWAGGRQAQAMNRLLDKTKPEGEFPAWDIVYDRLFLEDVWAEFPGRQTF